MKTTSALITHQLEDNARPHLKPVPRSMSQDICRESFLFFIKKYIAREISRERERLKGVIMWAMVINLHI